MFKRNWATTLTNVRNRYKTARTCFWPVRCCAGRQSSSFTCLELPCLLATFHLPSCSRRLKAIKMHKHWRQSSAGDFVVVFAVIIKLLQKGVQRASLYRGVCGQPGRCIEGTSFFVIIIGTLLFSYFLRTSIRGIWLCFGCKYIWQCCVGSCLIQSSIRAVLGKKILLGEGGSKSETFFHLNCSVVGVALT